MFATLSSPLFFTAWASGTATGLGLFAVVGAQSAFILRQGLMRTHLLSVVAICALMALGHARVITGALDPVASRLAALVAVRPRLALAAVLVGVMAVSGFVNDSPIVVLMIPLLLAATARA